MAPPPRKSARKSGTRRRTRVQVVARLVVSGSRGGRYEVEVLAGGKARCECKGFKYRGECRHVQAPEVQDAARAVAPARRGHAEVLLVADMLVAALRPYCARIEIVGSLSRRRADVKDIDLLMAPGAWSTERIVALFRSFGSPVHHGDSMGSIVLPNGLAAQLWSCEDPAVWGAALLHFIGPRDYNIRIRMRANRRGWQLSQHGLVDRSTGRLIAGRTEEEVLQALDLPWLPASLREGHRRLGPDPGGWK